jgi:type II secretory ATPase GspE/PulE/Tfp pilus assembly ATPase PilB-like protein
MGLVSIPVNIITVEEPVKYRISELVQVQIHEKGLGVKRKRGLSIYPSMPSPR